MNFCRSAGRSNRDSTHFTGHAAGRLGAAAALALLAGCAAQPGDKPVLDVAARLHVAAAAEAAGDTDVALAMYAGAAASAPDNADAQGRYGVALAEAGRVRQGATVLDRAVARNGGNATLLRQLARVELVQGHADTALRRYDQALAITPDDAATHVGRGVALDMLGRHDDAQAEYRGVLQRSPDDTAAANDLALSLMFTGRYAAARDTLERFADAPDMPDRLRATLALARAGAGDAAAAQQLMGNTLSGEQAAALASALNGI